MQEVTRDQREFLEAAQATLKQLDERARAVGLAGLLPPRTWRVVWPEVKWPKLNAFHVGGLIGLIGPMLTPWLLKLLFWVGLGQTPSDSALLVAFYAPFGVAAMWIFIASLIKYG